MIIKALVPMLIGFGITHFYISVMRMENLRLKNNKISTPKSAMLNEFTKQQHIRKKSFTPFKRHEGVVIVSKIMGHQVEIEMIMQSLCLMTISYNHRVNYDIIVFSTIKQNDETTQKIRRIVHPAKFQFVWENVTVANLLRNMTKRRRKFIMTQCSNKTKIKDFTTIDSWFLACRPEVGSLRYNWQAQFRSLHLWKHEALADYNYMVWMDADLFCTRPWNKDPVDFVIRNDLVVAFDAWPTGRGGRIELQRKIRDYFNTTLCRTYMNDDGDGNLYAKTGDDCDHAVFQVIGGWFHITNLNFYRQHIDWLETFIGEDQLSRNPDDQEALTSTATLLAPGRVWSLHHHGMNLSLAHNGFISGEPLFTRLFTTWYPTRGRINFSKRDHAKCRPYVIHDE